MKLVWVVKVTVEVCLQ